MVIPLRSPFLPIGQSRHGACFARRAMRLTLSVTLILFTLAASGIAACSAASAGSAPSPDAGSPTASGDGASPAVPDATSPDGPASTSAPDGGTYDPLAPQPDQSEGLTNVSSDLGAVLENGALAGACDAVDAGTADAKTTLLCGKWKFFYDPLGTSGIPAALVEFMASSFPNELGLGFSKLGLVPDPTSSTHLPLGMAPTVNLGGTVPAVAFTCASCHFAQLPDGRYAVGAPNHAYDYARHILDLVLVPTLGAGLGSTSQHDAAAVARVQPELAALSGNATLKGQLLQTLLPLAGLSLPAMTTDDEHAYALWPTGTMDFLIAPLPVDDHVLTVSKIQPLWGIPSPDEVKATGMTSALLASTGDAPDLDTFVWGFGVIGGANPEPTAAQRAPLVQYILSLRAPDNPSPPDPALVAKGAALYASAGCTACHDGPRGSGKRAYAIGEVGTDPAMADWADPDGGSTACCGVPTAAGGLTHGVKSPRLVGLWTYGRWLHDGALSSLDQVFCRDADAGTGGTGRPPAGTPPLQTVGHEFTCGSLADADKQALMAFLLSH